jgi:ABC-2 type transport system ATP-binding protein
VSIPNRETPALLGPNGAGKSTTIEMLLGLDACPGRRQRVAPVFGTLEPALRSIAAPTWARCCKTGGLLRDLTVPCEHGRR